MKSSKLLTIFSGAALLCAAAAANATLITYDSELGSDWVSTSTVDGATVINFNDGTCGYDSCSGNFDVVIGNQSGVYAAPFDVNAGFHDETYYLTVPKDLADSPVSATFALGTTANYFGLLWGSIDAYNTIDFLLGDSLVESWTGSMIIDPSAADGNQSAPSTNTYVNFFDLPTFDAVRLTSTGYAFESDNHAYATIAVPEPGTLALLATGLIGFAIIARRRTRAVAPCRM